MYNSEGASHYDAAVKFKHTALKSVATKCSCGVNTYQYQSCDPRENFSSRCICLKSEKRCTAECRCKNCSNPHGVRQSKVVGEKPGRKRRAHPYQKSFPASKDIALDRREIVPWGRWSEFEVIIVLSEIILRNFDWNVEQIRHFYSDLVYYSKAPFFIFFSLPQTVIFREKNYSLLIC